jgi:thiamine biosynthesis lipoprotein
LLSMTCFSGTDAEPAPPAGLTVERMRPLLGTFVSIRVEHLSEAQAHHAIACGFDAIAEVHALMSFHEASSDVARLNREAWHGPVAVHPHTLAVLRHALEVSRNSNGVFDITVGAELVARRVLPRPPTAPEPDPEASWYDIELLRGGRVRFARPLWIDLGGIAKGYAVDHAIARMALGPEAQSCINAGGDLSVSGPAAEPIRLGLTTPKAVPVVTLHNGSLASSTGVACWGAVRGAHLDGKSRRAVGLRRFASVVAQSCMTADALTKVVLAIGSRADGILRKFGAGAYLYSPSAGWRVLGSPDGFGPSER